MNYEPFPFRHVSDEEIAWAKEQRREHDRKYGKGSPKFPEMSRDRWAGYLYQLHFKKWGGEFIEDRTGEHLLSYDFGLFGFRIDVKGTIPHDYPPRHDFGVNVAEAHMAEGRKADTFVFGYFDSATQISYLLGWIDKDSVMQTGVFLNKGEPFPECPKWEVKVSCWHLKVFDLYPVDAEMVASSDPIQR